MSVVWETAARFISGCSKPRNEGDFREGVICKDQPCVAMLSPHGNNHPATMMMMTTTTMMGVGPPPLPAEEDTTTRMQPPAADGVARSAAVGHPEFLWQTQRGKRKRDPNLPKTRRQRYTKEQKDTILGYLLRDPNAKLDDVARRFGVPSGTLRFWYDEDRRKKAEAAESELANAGYDAAGAAAAAAAAADAAGDFALATENHLLQESHGEGDERPQKKRRQRYSNETKIQLILALESRPKASVKDVAREFGVAVGTARGWIDESDKIQKQAMENRRVGAKANPSKDPMKKIWDAILRLFELNSRLPVAQQLDLNVAVVKAIGLQARDVLLDRYKTNKDLLTETEFQAIQKFKASETWARKWAKDHQVISTKSTFNPVAVALDRIAELQPLIAQYPSEQVYTMATTILFYRLLPHRSYVSTTDDGPVRACKGMKSKDRLTLYICSNETGTDKLPIACIGKYKKPACLQVRAQRTLPYLSQIQALSDAGTFQKWWRQIFLPHIRNVYRESQKILLLVEDDGPCKAALLKDPTGQVRVESLPASPNNTTTSVQRKSHEHAPGQQDYGSTAKDNAAASKRDVPQCQPMALGIIETIKRRYRYRLLQDIMDTYEERVPRRKIADEANYPAASRGLREASMVNLCDAMRLLNGIWTEIEPMTILRAWQQTKLRLKHEISLDGEYKKGRRIKSDRRQTTREKKTLVDDLQLFFSSHDTLGVLEDSDQNQMEQAVEKLKNCFLYSDNTLIPPKEIFDSLEDWVFVEESDPVLHLFREEIKEEMNILYLAGLEDMPEKTLPMADEQEDPELDESRMTANIAKTEELLDYETAVALAGNIKATAVKLFQNGDVLGDLAVKLDDATDSIFRLLKKQMEKAKESNQTEHDDSSPKRSAKPSMQQMDADNSDQLPSHAPIDGDTSEQLDESVMAGVDLGDIGDIAGAVSVQMV